MPKAKKTPSSIPFARGFHPPSEAQARAAIGSDDPLLTASIHDDFHPVPAPTSIDDWLAQYVEEGQSFRQFVEQTPWLSARKWKGVQQKFVSSGNTIGEKYPEGVIHLVPLGDFDGQAAPKIDTLAEYMHRYLCIPVAVLPSIPLRCEGKDVFMLVKDIEETPLERDEMGKSELGTGRIGREDENIGGACCEKSKVAGCDASMKAKRDLVDIGAEDVFEKGATANWPTKRGRGERKENTSPRKTVRSDMNGQAYDRDEAPPKRDWGRASPENKKTEVEIQSGRGADALLLDGLRARKSARRSAGSSSVANIGSCAQDEWRRVSNRYNEGNGRRQLEVGSLLALLRSLAPRRALCTIALTMQDLFDAPPDLFVAGMAAGAHRVAVFSLYRYDPVLSFSSEFWHRVRERPVALSLREALVCKRACKLLVHEVAHLLGFDHCIWYACAMNGAGHLEEDYAQPIDLCPVDLHKLRVLTGCDILERYRALHSFYREHGMREEEAWTGRRLRALGTE